MTKRWTIWLAACLALAAPVAHAQDYDPDAIDAYNNDVDAYNNAFIPDPGLTEAPGTVPSGTTTTTTEEISHGVFASPFTVSPAVGVLGFGDQTGNYTSRIMEGLLADFDFRVAPTSQGSLGLETGFLFSHVGSAGANFFGSDVDNGTTQGANSFLIPIELVAGWHATDAFRTTLNFGANMLFRSIGSSMIVGRGDSDTNSLQVFPSAGLTAGWALGPAAGLTLRGDYIPTPADDMFTAALGLTFALA